MFSFLIEKSILSPLAKILFEDFNITSFSDSILDMSYRSLSKYAFTKSALNSKLSEIILTFFFNK